MIAPWIKSLDNCLKLLSNDNFPSAKRLRARRGPVGQRGRATARLHSTLVILLILETVRIGSLQASSTYGGSATCKECHPTEFQFWSSSHHGLAERPLRAALERAAFVPTDFFLGGARTNRAQFVANHYELVTTGFNSNVQPYRVERVIGCDPLKQFLTEATNGRWQAQQSAYDVNSNQWFDIYAGENRGPGEWGHWTGRGMNWNSMCAECHNTGLEKNYDENTDGYHTTLAEMSVGCEACHGPLKVHSDWQRTHSHGSIKDPTVFVKSPQRVLDICGSCHSRRDDLSGKFVDGDSLFDHYSIEILDETDQWYADGQVHGEDYEFASFISSKMSQSDVTCMDCHNPHSGKTRAAGNDLCMRCHSGAFPKAPVITPLQHSHHSATSSGSSCIGCHMPVTVYMQRHPRHDHGFTIPDPLLTTELNTPNACNRCHSDKP